MVVVVGLKSDTFRLNGHYEVTKDGSNYHIKKAPNNNWADPKKNTFTREELIGPWPDGLIHVEITDEDSKKIKNMGWWGGYRKKLNTRRKRRNKSRKTNKYRFFR